MYSTAGLDKSTREGRHGQLSVHMFDTAYTSNYMHSVLPSSVEIISHYQITGLDKCSQRETHAGPTGAVALK